jgi:hypothetical protein
MTNFTQGKEVLMYPFIESSNPNVSGVDLQSDVPLRVFPSVTEAYKASGLNSRPEIQANMNTLKGKMTPVYGLVSLWRNDLPARLGEAARVPTKRSEFPVHIASLPADVYHVYKPSGDG